MADPFDFSGQDPNNSGFLGVSPSAWQHLAMFGGNLAQAANARTSGGFLANGAGFAGPLGAAITDTGQQSMVMARNQSQLRSQGLQNQHAGMENQLLASQVPVQKLQNQQTLDYMTSGKLPAIYQNQGQWQPPLPGGQASAGGADGSDYASSVNSMEGGPGKNPASSASGYGQLIDANKIAFAKANPQYFTGQSPEQMSATFTNPQVGAAATEWLAQQNAPILQSAGVPPTGANLAMAHRLGPKAAIAAAQAPDDAPLGTVLVSALGQDAANQYVQANPAMGAQTVGGFKRQFAGVPNYAPGGGQRGVQVAGPGAPSDGGQQAPQGQPAVPPHIAQANEYFSIANQYDQHAGQIEQLAAFAKQRGMPPPPQDPQAIRQAGQAFRQAGLELQTAGPKAGSAASAALPSEMAKLGLNPDGTPKQGGIASPGYKGQVAGAEAEAKFPFTTERLSPGGALAVGGKIVSSVPAPSHEVILSGPHAGTRGTVLRDPLTNAQVGGGSGAPGADGLPTGFLPNQLPPVQEEFGKVRGENLAHQFDKIDSDAAAAKDSNYLFENMRRDAQSWQMGKFADIEGDARAYLSAIAHTFGVQTPELDNKLADYQAFNKSSGMLLRAAVHDTSSRAAVQEYTLIGHSLPQPTTSEQGFGQVADQWQGLNDFRMAKQIYAQGYAGKPQDFNVEFNSKVSPTSFMLNRMSQTPTGQQDKQALIVNMSKNPEGKIALGRMLEQYRFARDNGLFDGVPARQTAPPLTAP